MSEANISRLVDKLSRMRGAALKIGQFMSIQGAFPLLVFCRLYGFADPVWGRVDAHVLPEQIEKVLRQVQNSAHYMPNWQMEVPISRFSLSIRPTNWRSVVPESHDI